VRRYSSEEKELVVSEWKASGLSRTAYAKANGLNLTTLRNWTKEGAEGSCALVEIPEEISREAESGPVSMIVVERREIRITLPCSCGEKLLTAAIKALEAA
jgi:transposase-like protein